MDVTLTAETGRPAGSRSSNRLRADGKVPGVVYGLGNDPVAVTVAWPELRRALTTEAGINALITLESTARRTSPSSRTCSATRCAATCCTSTSCASTRTPSVAVEVPDRAHR